MDQNGRLGRFNYSKHMSKYRSSLLNARSQTHVGTFSTTILKTSVQTLNT